MLFLLISDCIRIITAAIQCISLIISGQHAGISFTCRHTQWSKKFRSTERIHCIDKIKCEIWHRRAPLCKILRLSGQTCGNTPPNRQNLSLSTKLYLTGDSFPQFFITKFAAFVRIYTSALCF